MTSNMTIKITTQAQISRPIQVVFDYVLPIDLSHIFMKYKFLPGVIRTNEKEKWIKPGLSRTVFFDDGNTAQEELLEVNSPEYFAYKITNFTSPLRFLVNQINGNWKFSSPNSSFTKIVWEYELIPKNPFTSWIISTFLLNDMKVFLQNSVDVIAQDLQ
jgi:hypothetical protein